MVLILKPDKGRKMSFLKHHYSIIFSFLLILFSFRFIYSQNPSDEKLIQDCIHSTVKLFEIQEQVKDIHPFLKKLHPIAIVENGQFFIFDYDSAKGGYTFTKKQPVPFPVSSNIQASFPINGRSSCVVTRKIFDSMYGYVTILHEFIHCTQAELCESGLRDKIILGREGKKNMDAMWELNHPFPYDNPEFIENYADFMKALDENDKDMIVHCRMQLRKILDQADFEYMVWQEWKEGFARFIENRLQKRLNLNINTYGSEKPYNRVTFYVGGSKLIEYLVRENSELFVNIELLFDRMMNM